MGLPLRDHLGRNPFQVLCGRGGLLDQQLRSSKRLQDGIAVKIDT